jgi:methionine sulfoxide reductase heme-binding subunit
MDVARNRHWQDWLLWGILAIPAALMVFGATRADVDMADLLRESGEFSARIMIVAMMIGPLADIIGQVGWIRWLLKHRRHFGVAAFLYAVLHLFFYFVDMEWSVADLMAELDAPGIWTGWIAIFVMLLPALASNDAAMQMLRRNWKRVQQLAYVVAIATVVHWIFLAYEPGPALVHFLPLLALNLARLAKRMTRRTAS